MAQLLSLPMRSQHPELARPEKRYFLLVPAVCVPGFRLVARWNNLVETVKTRKNTGNNGGKWARYGLKCEGVGITWGSCNTIVRLLATDKTVRAMEPGPTATDNPASIAAFRDAGHKLVMWHGWADQMIMPQGSIDYYNQVRLLKMLIFRQIF